MENNNILKKYITVPILVAGAIVGTAINYANAADENKNINSTVTENKINLMDENKLPFTEEEYKQKSGSELAKLIREKKITSEEVVNTAYKVIEKENPELNAVITERKEEAIKEAKEIDAKVGKENRPFEGVPILLKGLGHVYKGSDKSNGSLLYKGEVSKFDSSVAKGLKDLGFVILGQTNYPEYGFRNITDSKLFGPANNPWDKTRNTGGSSGGSAAAVASGMTPIASGSDAGGSIRIPSAWTGLIGLKTSRAMTDKGSKDSANTVVHFPLVKSVDDAELLLDTLSTKRSELIDIKDIKTLKIGYTYKSPMGTEVSDDAKKAVLNSIEFLKSQGFQVEKVEWPINGRDLMKDYTYGNLGYPLGSLSDSQLEKMMKKQGITKEDLDPLTWAFSKTKAKDIDVKVDFKERIKFYENIMKKFHEKYPILLTPTNAVEAPLNTDEYVTKKDKEDQYNIQNLAKSEKFSLLNRQWEPMLRKTPFTEVANLTGEPALSLPTYLTEKGLPMGIMINGKWGMDKVLLKFGKLFEDNNKFIMRPDIRNTIKYPSQEGNKIGENYYGTKFEFRVLPIDGEKDIKVKKVDFILPIGKEYSIKYGEKAEAKNNIANSGTLPEGTTYKYKEEPSKEVGEQKVIVLVKVPNQEEIEIPAILSIDRSEENKENKEYKEYKENKEYTKPEHKMYDHLENEKINSKKELTRENKEYNEKESYNKYINNKEIKKLPNTGNKTSNLLELSILLLLISLKLKINK